MLPFAMRHLIRAVKLWIQTFERNKNKKKLKKRNASPLCVRLLDKTKLCQVFFQTYLINRNDAKV